MAILFQDGGPYFAMINFVPGLRAYVFVYVLTVFTTLQRLLA